MLMGPGESSLERVFGKGFPKEVRMNFSEHLETECCIYVNSTCKGPGLGRCLGHTGAEREPCRQCVLSQGQGIDPTVVPAVIIVQGALPSSLPSTWRHFLLGSIA